MATKPEAAKAEPVAPPVKAVPNGMKILIIGSLVFLLVAVAAAGTWLFLSRQSSGDEMGEEPAQVAPKGPPTFLPLENMVVNLADAGGEKVAQIGITLELVDAHATDQVKPYLPSIRSGILLLISQRTAEELLRIEGKEKLAADIMQEASRPFVDARTLAELAKSKTETPKAKKKTVTKGGENDNPVRGVLFSSFIVQ